MRLRPEVDVPARAAVESSRRRRRGRGARVNSQQRWTLVATTLASAIVSLASTMVNVALPRIGRELPSSVFGVLEGQSYVSNGYLVTLSALLVLAVALNDYYGPRRVVCV